MDTSTPTSFGWMDNRNVRAMLVVFLVIVSLFFAAKTIQEIKSFGKSDMAQNIISVDGYAEVATIADTANISFSVTESDVKVAGAQNKATEKINNIVGYLKGAGIEKKDIKTDSYNISPKYEYQARACVSGVCPGGKQVLTGYEVSQTITVKIRNTEKAGDILVALGDKGASNVSNLSFTVDTEKREELKLQAKEAAIADARMKAEKIADALGVKIVRVTSMYENGQPYYDYYAEGKGGDSVRSLSSVMPAAAPELPQGESKITANVMVSFEIK